MRRIHWWAAAAVLVVLVLIPAGIHYWGVFNVAADQQHWPLTRRVFEAVRERSVAARAVHIPVPTLDDAERVRTGAAHYDAMCRGCHLAPGLDRTDLRDGLNPQPPDLTGSTPTRAPGERFWIIKHGVRMTGMPAWGRTHDDESVWAIVAFLERLPQLDVDQYNALLAEAAAHGEGGHHAARDANHAHGEQAPSARDAADDAPGVPHGHRGHEHGETQ